MRTFDGPVEAAGTRFAIVVARWNELVTKELLEGALDELGRFGAKHIDVVKVPGTWELPVAIKALFEGPNRPDAVIALGCILLGETVHGRLLASDVSSALMRLQVEAGVPIAWGVLTPDNQDQALDRAGLKMGNKGREAAAAAAELASLIRRLQAPAQ
jgi:6,7-dimethyl-8-ribityllumazine synthase